MIYTVGNSTVSRCCCFDACKPSPIALYASFFVSYTPNFRCLPCCPSCQLHVNHRHRRLLRSKACYTTQLASHRLFRVVVTLKLRRLGRRHRRQKAHLLNHRSLALNPLLKALYPFRNANLYYFVSFESSASTSQLTEIAFVQPMQEQ